MSENIAFLFKIRLWQYDPYEYLLVYAQNEDEARKKLVETSGKKYNSGTPIQSKDLILETYGL